MLPIKTAWLIVLVALLCRSLLVLPHDWTPEPKEAEKNESIQMSSGGLKSLIVKKFGDKTAIATFISYSNTSYTTNPDCEYYINGKRVDLSEVVKFVQTHYFIDFNYYNGKELHIHCKELFVKKAYSSG